MNEKNPNPNPKLKTSPSLSQDNNDEQKPTDDSDTITETDFDAETINNDMELPPEIAEAIDTLMQGVISDDEVIEIAERCGGTGFENDCYILIENVLDLKRRLVYLGAALIGLNAAVEEANSVENSGDDIESYANHMNFSNINWGTPA